MHKAQVLLSALMLTLFISVPVFARDNSSFFAQIERAIKEKEPEWKLVHKLISKNNKYVSYEWRSGKSSVGVLISVHASSEEAIKTYEGLPYDFEVLGLKMRMLKDKVPNLGDESYVWEDYNDKSTTGVNLRKGKVVVHTSAPSIEIAKRFALDIADEIPAS